MDDQSINYALEPNKYLEKIKNETDPIKKQIMLKKYFTERITKSLYQNMDLLHAMDADFDQFKKMYSMISKDLYINILLAVNTLTIVNDSFDTTETDNEYSICESYSNS